MPISLVLSAYDAAYHFPIYMAFLFLPTPQAQAPPLQAEPPPSPSAHAQAEEAAEEAWHKLEETLAHYNLAFSALTACTPEGLFQFQHHGPNFVVLAQPAAVLYPAPHQPPPLDETLNALAQHYGFPLTLAYRAKGQSLTHLHSV